MITGISISDGTSCTCSISGMLRFRRMSLTVPICTPRNLTGAPGESPLTLPLKNSTYCCVFWNRRPEPSITITSTARPIAPRTKAPTRAGLTRLPMLPRCFLGVLAAGEETVDYRIVAVGEQLVRIAVGDHRAALGVEKDAVVANGEDTRELVRDDHDRRTETIAQFQDQIVE